MEFVSIPGGAFDMGSSVEQVAECVAFWGARLVDPRYDVDRFRQWIMKEYPRHRVEVPSYAIGRCPVTNDEYRTFVARTARPVPESLARDEPGDHPVWGVSFEDALAFCVWMGERLRRRCRLPSEAEWERAARGPSGREYPFGDRFDPGLCNTLEAGIGHTTPVDRYAGAASEFGVWDLAGNVEEYTMDCYAPYPGGTFIEDDLSRILGPRYRVLRGGSFARGGDLARSARRHGPFPAPEFRYIGFRVVAEEQGSGAAVLPGRTRATHVPAPLQDVPLSSTGGGA
jgi:formylglycine-generating enzyme required for sulfatase activity